MIKALGIPVAVIIVLIGLAAFAFLGEDNNKKQLSNLHSWFTLL